MDKLVCIRYIYGMDYHGNECKNIKVTRNLFYPEFTVSFDNPEVKSIFVIEPDINQITQNYLSREGGDLQQYRAEISIAYGKWIADTCKENNIRVIEARPWSTALRRAIESLSQSI